MTNLIIYIPNLDKPKPKREVAQGVPRQKRENVKALAEANGVKIEFIRKKDVRKENRIQKILKERSEQPGKDTIFNY